MLRFLSIITFLFFFFSLFSRLSSLLRLQLALFSVATSSPSPPTLSSPRLFPLRASINSILSYRRLWVRWRCPHTQSCRVSRHSPPPATSTTKHQLRRPRSLPRGATAACWRSNCWARALASLRSTWFLTLLCRRVKWHNSWPTHSTMSPTACAAVPSAMALAHAALARRCFGALLVGSSALA